MPYGGRLQRVASVASSCPPPLVPVTAPAVDVHVVGKIHPPRGPCGW